MSQMIRMPQVLFHMVKLNRRQNVPCGAVKCIEKKWFFSRDLFAGAKLKNLGFYGLEFYAPERLERGRHLYFQVDLPGEDQPLKFGGRVLMVRQEEEGFATCVQFEAMSSRTVHHLHQVLYT